VVRPLGAPEWQEGGGFEFARVEKNPKKTLDACLNRARIRHIIEGKGEGHTRLEASVACVAASCEAGAQWHVQRWVHAVTRQRAACDRAGEEEAVKWASPVCTIPLLI
jgi:hypothetical protein